MRIAAMAIALGCFACGEESEVVPIPEAPPPPTDCERAWSNLVRWSGGTSDSDVDPAIVASCEEERSLGTSGRLECLLEPEVESAALCVSRLERRDLMATCASESEEEERADCEALLGEPSALILEARTRALTSGDWLSLWSCHVFDDDEDGDGPSELRTCGLGVLERIFVADCLAGRFDSDACDARWALHRPRAEDWIRARLEHPSASQNTPRNQPPDESEPGGNANFSYDDR